MTCVQSCLRQAMGGMTGMDRNRALLGLFSANIPPTSLPHSLRETHKRVSQNRAIRTVARCRSYKKDFYLDCVGAVQGPGINCSWIPPQLPFLSFFLKIGGSFKNTHMMHVKAAHEPENRQRWFSQEKWAGLCSCGQILKSILQTWGMQNFSHRWKMLTSLSLASS